MFDRDGLPNGRTTVTLGVGEDIRDADVGIINTAALPATGGNGLARTLSIAGALILLGLVLLVGRRRRRGLGVTMT